MQTSKSATLYNGAMTQQQQQSPEKSTAETLVRPSFLKLKRQAAQTKSANIVFDTCPTSNECRTFFRKTTAAPTVTLRPSVVVAESITDREVSPAAAFSLRQRRISPNKQHFLVRVKKSLLTFRKKPKIKCWAKKSGLKYI